MVNLLHSPGGTTCDNAGRSASPSLPSARNSRGCAAGMPEAASGRPHALQNLASGALALRQFGHAIGTGCPQPSQNRASDATSRRHCGHSTCADPVAQRRNWNGAASVDARSQGGQAQRWGGVGRAPDEDPPRAAAATGEALPRAAAGPLLLVGHGRQRECYDAARRLTCWKAWL